MNTDTFVILGLFAILIVAVLLRFRSSAEGKFSIGELLNFSFKGKNVDDTNEIQEIKGALLQNSIVKANEFIGRDKVTVVQAADSEVVPEEKIPKLELYLFEQSGDLLNEISFDQPQPDGVIQDHQFLFGISLLKIQTRIVSQLPGLI